MKADKKTDRQMEDTLRKIGGALIDAASEQCEAARQAVAAGKLYVASLHTSRGETLAEVAKAIHKALTK